MPKLINIKFFFFSSTSLKNKINKEIKAGAAQLALALTRKLSNKMIIIIGNEKINKNLFSKSKRKDLDTYKKDKNKIGPTIKICETKNFNGSSKLRLRFFKFALLEVWAIVIHPLIIFQ